MNSPESKIRAQDVKEGAISLVPDQFFGSPENVAKIAQSLTCLEPTVHTLDLDVR